MNWNDLEKHFSSARLGRYRASCGGDEAKAATAYVNNMLLSEAMMPMLNVLEIALKNGIHRQLSTLYRRADWWEAWAGNPAFAWQTKEVVSAKAKLQRREETATTDKIVAELTFGFWSSLFNGSFQSVLWKDLRLVFPRCPKHQRQRHAISSALNQVRDLRNRVFHHEQLLWLTPSLLDLHTKGTEVIGWLDPKLVPWLARYDRLPASWDAFQPV
ncbi:Abi family protein [Undibacterium jejuense]|uniref:Abi family protein n=1 Tax=Undibacterium jejuense TaxID=1344949 RepID=A0A923HJQ8_9BURK|nr:Abi family protein [Undibacterium jejuense]MBC3864325.1 Abi family protein [Undibacterium jejuense]